MSRQPRSTASAVACPGWRRQAPDGPLHRRSGYVGYGCATGFSSGSCPGICSPQMHSIRRDQVRGDRGPQINDQAGLLSQVMSRDEGQPAVRAPGAGSRDSRCALPPTACRMMQPAPKPGTAAPTVRPVARFPARCERSPGDRLALAALAATLTVRPAHHRTPQGHRRPTVPPLDDPPLDQRVSTVELKNH